MAMEARALVIGHGWSSVRIAAKLPSAFPRRSIEVYCKGRNKSLSTQRRRQIKRVSLDKSTLKMEVQPNDNRTDKAEDTSSPDVLNSAKDALSNADNTDINNKEDFSLTSAEEIDIMIEGSDDQQGFHSIQGEDLINMIKNAEKNIMLLNQARVQALKELDKILLEKEDLQTEINVLEMKLAETNARIKVAAQDKVKIEFLEGQLGEVKNEVSSRSVTDEQSWNSNSPFINDSASSALLELDALRKENKLLKDDIETLKMKLADMHETEQRVLKLEKESSSLEVSNNALESKYATIKEDVAKLATLEHGYKTLSIKVEHLQTLVDDDRQSDQTVLSLQHKHEFENKVAKLEGLLEEANSLKLSSQKFQQYDELLQQKIRVLEERLQISDQEIRSLVQLYQESVEEFHDTLIKLKEESERRSRNQTVEDMPWRFWSHILLTIDGWLLEKKMSNNDAKILREMAWKKDSKIRDAYLACKGKNEQERLTTFLQLSPSRRGPRLHIIHVAAEMAPVAKVGGLGDVVCGLGKALQRRGHLVEIILPKYDCMLNDKVHDLKELDVVVQSYFDGKLFENKIWVGTVEGLPVYFIEPHHPSKFFWRGKYYGDHDDFKRFSFFSRAALELLYQSGKKPDIIHCHDWQTAFVAPLYWDIYATKGFDSARICFTCHNFEYQGAAPASELASCGLDVHHLNRPDRMQDNSAHDKVNPIKGAIVFSNIVTTVSSSYAQEVRTMEGGQGLHETLKFYSRKFVGILNGIDTDAWNPLTDNFVRVQYSADDLQGKVENKNALRKLLKLSTANDSQPLVGCVTRLVPQKGVHLIRHAIYRTLELGGQFVLLGSSPVPHIQREFEVIANHFENHSNVRLLLKYDEALSHLIYAASDMFVIPSMFEPCGLTQMIAMRYGSVPIVRKTGGLNDSVFDIDDNAVPLQYRNGFTFASADEQGLNGAMERAFGYYMKNPDGWHQLVQNDMRMDFSWASPASQYEELYEKSVARARAAARM